MITAQELEKMSSDEFTTATKKLPMAVKEKLAGIINFDGLAELLNSNVCRLSMMKDMIKPKGDGI